VLHCLHLAIFGACHWLQNALIHHANNSIRLISIFAETTIQASSSTSCSLVIYCVKSAPSRIPCCALLGGETSPSHLLLLLLMQVPVDDGEHKKFHPLDTFVPEDSLGTPKKFYLSTGLLCSQRSRPNGHLWLWRFPSHSEGSVTVALAITVPLPISDCWIRNPSLPSLMTLLAPLLDYISFSASCWFLPANHQWILHASIIGSLLALLHYLLLSGHVTMMLMGIPRSQRIVIYLWPTCLHFWYNRETCHSQFLSCSACGCNIFMKDAFHKAGVFFPYSQPPVPACSLVPNAFNKFPDSPGLVTSTTHPRKCTGLVWVWIGLEHVFPRLNESGYADL